MAAFSPPATLGTFPSQGQGLQRAWRGSSRCRAACAGQGARGVSGTAAALGGWALRGSPGWGLSLEPPDSKKAQVAGRGSCRPLRGQNSSPQCRTELDPRPSQISSQPLCSDCRPGVGRGPQGWGLATTWGVQTGPLHQAKEVQIKPRWPGRGMPVATAHRSGGAGSGQQSPLGLEPTQTASPGRSPRRAVAGLGSGPSGARASSQTSLCLSSTPAHEGQQLQRGGPPQRSHSA